MNGWIAPGSGHSLSYQEIALSNRTADTGGVRQVRRVYGAKDANFRRLGSVLNQKESSYLATLLFTKLVVLCLSRGKVS